MKKITAFFMAVLPFFVTILLFAAGFIVKEVGPTIHVEKVVIEDLESLELKKTSDTDPVSATVKAHVLPVAASNQDIVWKSDNTNIADVDQNGKVTCKNWGTTKIYACSKENQNIQASLDVEVYDNVIHKLVISDEEQEALNNFGLNQRRQVQYTAIPNTRITDPTIVFALHNKEDSQYLDIASDGTIMPKKTTSNHKVKVDMYPKTDSTRVTQFDVNIILGVDEIDVKDKTTAITTSAEYDLYEQLVTAPTEKTKLTRDSFIYTSSNEDIARIDSEGKATFIQPGEVQFEATYKRDKSLKTTKTVISSCTFIRDVYFNADKYQVELDWNAGTKSWHQKAVDHMYCSTFPESDNWADKLIIESSDPNILEVQMHLAPGSSTKYEYKYVAKKPGIVYVLAQAATGESFSSFTRDAALVVVQGKYETSTDYGMVKEETVSMDDQCTSYSLWRNIKMPTNGLTPQQITFTTTADFAEIDDDGTLHIKKFPNETDEVTIPVSVIINEKTVGTFNVKSKPTTPIDPNSINDNNIKLEAGKRYKFADGSSPVFDIFHSYRNKFYYYSDTDGVTIFTPKCGMNISNFVVRHGLFDREYEQLIAIEEPVFIASDLSPFYSTEETEVDHKTLANVRTIPSTATKNDGNPYTIKSTYAFETEDGGKVVDGVATFNKAGLLFVDTQIEEVPEIVAHTIVKSTYGALSKFQVYEKEEPTSSDLPLISNSTRNLAPNGELKFYVNNLTESQAQQIKLQPVSDLSSICELSKEVKNVGTWLSPKYQIIFTIKAKEGAFGEEYVSFNTKAYAVYLKVKINTELSGFTITHNRQRLVPQESETILNQTTSYIDDPLLRYRGNPISATDDFKVYLNGTELSKGIDDTFVVNTTEKTIDLKKSKLTLNKNNVLKFEWTVKHGESTETKSQIYNILYTDDYSKFNIEIQGAEITQEGGQTIKNLYLNYNEIQKTFYLKANGLTDTELFNELAKSGKLTVDFEHDAATHKIEFLQDSLTVSGIPSPSIQNPTYTNKMTLKYNGTAIGDPYVITRDVVSKVKFPGHDNTDRSDKMGMQKVHIYGDKSFNEKNEIIDGYKLPIELYDFNNQPITNEEIKAKAFKTLRYWVDEDKATFEYKDGYVNIKFKPENLYTPDEINNNAFDTKAGKNITFHAENKTKTSTASYTFVAVEGYNVYNQEQLKAIYNAGGVKSIAVLQNDFGTSSGAKFDDPIFKSNCEFKVSGIYGNGHTMLFADLFNDAGQDSRGIYTGFAFNVTLAGCKDEDVKWIEGKEIYRSVQFNATEDKIPLDKHLYRYVHFKNTGAGFMLNDASKDLYFKNCLFSNGLHGEFTNNGNPCKASCYIEDCSFFNAGDFAIWTPVTNGTGTCKIYFKGKIGLYNFKSKEMFSRFWGVDASSFAWPIARTAAYNASMLQTGPDSREYINSFMVSFLNPDTYFWDAVTQQYIKAEKGTEATGEYLGKYVNINLSFIKKGLEASFWGTKNPSVIGGAPNFMDEFNPDGTLNVDFLNKLVSDLTRIPTWF